MHLRCRPAGDAGAVAIIVAAMALLLFGAGALAVDLGNAFTRKRDVQYQADFATLAGGAGLPAASLMPADTDPAIVKAADYLFRNLPQDDSGLRSGTRDDLRTALTDSDPNNGQAYYGHFNAAGQLVPSRNELTVRTPPALVKFGLAAVFGTSAANVAAAATVSLRSPGGGTMPFYAVRGCDYGPQTLSDPPNGHVLASTVQMQFPSDTNRAQLGAISPTQVPVYDPAKAQPTITITGQGLASMSKVGFFRSTDLYPNLVMPPTVISSDSIGKKIQNVVVPKEVTQVIDEEYGSLWWVRVYGAKNGRENAWSAASEAVPLRIGDAYIRCRTGSDDGNFGSLKLPRTDGMFPTWLPRNIAVGLQAPLTLGVFPGGPPPAYCPPGTPSRIYSSSTPPTLLPGTNCVDTDTGLTTSATTQGLITGTPARLTNKSTAPGCSPSRGSDLRPVRVQNNNYGINDDTLSCFLTTDATIGSIANASYAGGPVLSPDIYSSPRFFWVPVLGSRPPDRGGSQFYSIVDFRAAFLTSETNASTKASPILSDTNNGLTFSTNGVSSMGVVFFNINALPADAGTVDPSDYMGVGPAIITLTD